MYLEWLFSTKIRPKMKNIDRIREYYSQNFKLNEYPRCQNFEIVKTMIHTIKSMKPF